MEAGKLDLQMEPSSLSGICQAALQLIKGMAHKKNQNVAFSMNQTAITVLGDARRLKQVFVNLLSNAIKYSPEKSAIGFEVVADPQTKMVKIAVWDHGIGIATKDLKKLFQPFVQLDSSLSRQQTGTGLGLALVEKLVNLHGGSVQVESTPGEGSRFTVTLSVLSFGPVPQFRKATLPSQFQRALIVEDNNLDASRLSRYLKMLGMVMLVDDNEINRFMLEDFLRSKHFNVVTAGSGLDFLARVGEIQPDVVLMDIQMPGIDGLETTRRLRAHSNSELASVPVIAITALAMPGDRERCLQAGANEYLSKPLRLEEMRALIQKYIEKDIKSNEYTNVLPRT